MIKAVKTRRGVRARTPGAQTGATAIMSVALAIASTVAQAADPGVSSAGLLKFDNVRVVAAPATTGAAPSTNAGMRAFVDPSTGQMRSPSPEEMQTMASTNATPSSNMPQWATVHGGVGITLDASFLQYSVVARQADGSLAEYCVTGIDQAHEIVNHAPVSQAVPRNGGRDER